MSKFVICGDTHGTIDISKVEKYFEGRECNYTKDDYLIILGDVCVCSFDPSNGAETRRILRDLPVTTLFIDGNHENFDELNSYPSDEWNGGKVHFIEQDIIHLMRGQLFDIDGTTFFTMGGAYSIDKNYRSEGLDWFPEELPSEEEYEEGLNNLENVNNQVDYILTHTGPREVIAAMGYGDMSDDENELRMYLQHVADETEFTTWFFGHFHDDQEIDDQYLCLFEDMVEI